MSLRETRDSNTISFREHEVHELRRKILNMQDELFDLRQKLSALEAEDVQAPTVGTSCISVDGPNVPGLR